MNTDDEKSEKSDRNHEKELKPITENNEQDDDENTGTEKISDDDEKIRKTKKKYTKKMRTQ